MCLLENRRKSSSTARFRAIFPDNGCFSDLTVQDVFAGGTAGEVQVPHSSGPPSTSQTYFVVLTSMYKMCSLEISQILAREIP